MTKHLFLAALAVSFAAPASAITIDLAVQGLHHNGIGIDYFEPTGQVVMSSFYPTGNPHNLELHSGGASGTQFSALGNIADEIKIATVRSADRGGYVPSPPASQSGGGVQPLAGGGGNPAPYFAPGTVFLVGRAGDELTRVLPDGSSSVFADIGAQAGRSVGNGEGVYVDRTGVWGGDVLVGTSTGELWRVNASGQASFVVDVGNQRIEGILTIPDDPARYGPLAGKVLLGNNGESRVIAVAADGSVDAYATAFAIEDLDLVMEGENLIGVDLGAGRFRTAGAAQFADFAGEIMAFEEDLVGDPVFGFLRWDFDANTLMTEIIDLAFGNAPLLNPQEWTFAPIAFGNLAAPGAEVPEPAMLGLFGLGALALGFQRRRSA